MIQCGDIGISNRPTGWYPAGVRFFTRSKWSHTFIVANPYLERPTALEADLKVQLVDFEKEYIHKKADSWIVYEPIKASKEEKAHAAADTFRYYNGETYGFLQIPWFMFRAFLKWIGIGKTANNWFPGGVICSELVLYYLKALNEEYAQAFAHLDLDETSPQDIYSVVSSRLDLFRFKAARDI